MRLHLITGLGRGGAEAMLVKICCGGARFSFATLMQGGELRGVLRGRANDIGTIFSRGRDSWRLLVRLSTEERLVIMSWMYHSDLAAAMLTLINPSLRVIWNLRNSLDADSVFKPSTHLLIRVAAMASSLPFCIVSNSERGLTTHRDLGYRNKRFTKIPNGFEVPGREWINNARRRIRCLWNIGEGDRLIGLVARYAPQKNVKRFLEAMEIATLKNPNLKIAMVGKGMSPENQELVDLILKHVGAEKVILAGERSDSIECIAGLDVLCLTSDAEGFPNVVGEALSCGVICVTTDVGDCRDIIGDCGYVVPREDTQGIAAKCLEALELSSEQKIIISRRARARIVEKYSLEYVAEKYERLFKSVEMFDEGQVI